MWSRAEIAKIYASSYVAASKGDKGRLLDEVCAVTGWSRDNARRRLTAAAKSRPRPVPKRRARPPKYSTDAAAVLSHVWAMSGGMCGKYLAVVMATQLEALERHGELVDGQRGYSRAVRSELLSMSAATIDRYLAPARAAVSRPSPLLRSSVKIRKVGGQMATEPGFFVVDTVANCGPTLNGDFVRTVNFTDVFNGWVFTRSVRNSAHVHVLSALSAAEEHIPYGITGLDVDSRGEFMNRGIVDWAVERGIMLTRPRPYCKTDQATTKSKNNHLVRRYAFYHRYDTPEELAVLNRLWPLVNDRLNFFTPTKKPVGWVTNRAGRRVRLYDKPATPFDRLIIAGILSRAQRAELIAYHSRLNPADLARRIAHLQSMLVQLAKGKTDRLRDAIAGRLPDTTTGVERTG